MQYLQVLIVDDEAIVRKGIRNIIDWEKLGCRIVSEAQDGEEALVRIRSERPDIVLLDITMRGLSGIDVLKEVHQNKDKYSSQPDFLILSGYSDFSYAQSAVNFGAKGYITKPIDEDILEEKIKEIASQRKSRQALQTFREDLEEKSKAKSFSNFFLTGKADEELDIADTDSFRIAIISTEKIALEEQDKAKSIEESFEFVEHIAFFIKSMFVIIFKNAEMSALELYIKRFAARFSPKAQGSFFVLSSSEKGKEGALKAYNEAIKLYDLLFFFKQKAFITSDIVAKDKEISCRLTQKNIQNADCREMLDCIDELMAYIEIYDLQKINSLLSSKRKWLIESSFSENEIKKLAMAFIVDAQNALKMRHVEKELDTVAAIDLVHFLDSENYFDDVMKILSDFIYSLAESFSENSSNSTILKVIQYIKANYQTELRLELLGDLFNCNSAYLGKKFRAYTGVSFNTYLDIIRIEEAKKLILSSDMKIYEIATVVGYNTSDYFYLKFRKHTGLTPKEFKAQGSHQ